MDYLPEVRHTAAFIADWPPSFQIARESAAADTLPAATFAATAENAPPVRTHGPVALSPRAPPISTRYPPRMSADAALGCASPPSARPGTSVAVSPCTTTASVGFGERLERRCARVDGAGRRDTVVAESRRRRSAAWVERVVGRLSGVIRGRRRRSPEDAASPLLASPSEEGASPLTAATASPTDDIENAYPLSPPPAYTSPSSRGSNTSSRPSADWLRVPHPDFASEGHYATALRERVWRGLEVGVFEEDVLDFRFAGASGNQSEGVSSLFYPRSSRVASEWGGSEDGDGAGAAAWSPVSRVELLEEIRETEPSWGEEWAASVIGDASVIS